jgi:hypothetical protein
VIECKFRKPRCKGHCVLINFYVFFFVVALCQTLCRFVFLSYARVYYDGFLECLQQGNDVYITMSYTQQDARSIT